MSELKRADASDHWMRVRGKLRKEYGPNEFNRWVGQMTLQGMDDTTVSIAVPTVFVRDWVQNHYGSRIRTLFQQENPGVKSVEFIVLQPGTKTRTKAAGRAPSPLAASPLYATPGSDTAEPPRPAAPEGGSDDLTHSTPLDPRFTFENFVVGPSNELAYHACVRVAEGGPVPFNPLFLYGESGLGKTHLLHAIARRIRERQPFRKVLTLSAEQFIYRFVKAIRDKETLGFKEIYRSVDVLIVDDIQFIAGKESTQVEFFHTFNALVEQGSQIVLSADRMPTDIENLGDRLRSRLASGLVVDVHKCPYELRLAILESRARELGAEVPRNVLEYMAEVVPPNGRELTGALIQVVTQFEMLKRPLTLDLAQEVLRKHIRVPEKSISVAEIQKKVADHYQIRVQEMQSARRAQAVARPRQVAMYLAKNLTRLSLPAIGQAFGGRDHTTVLYALRKVQALMNEDREFADDVDFLRRVLET
ncbi:chromosomal replication initiator protein DnaA [Phaeovibrio sulfidiphilus]|uniref:Chromosomal replication initiator protein DnaA n=1 Tax=Phaeovibrio sulfidiphilus TaxID=1220600 RepID=A0A8J6YTJ1_9PROT|nr:chromosomal replication initiator protein DnaA [Phaeovibrio sulfidiphilus]MBE1236149.1 chromosomal replication initiator protein DnaA [Phaeovibrio sulfidiphilus]